MVKIITPSELKAIREECGMYRPQFASKVGISPRMMKYYEDGDKEIPLKIHNAVKWVRHCYRLRKIKQEQG